VIPTSIHCREQEGLHRDRAAKATLINVRGIAEKAAAAWAGEAVRAEERESRYRGRVLQAAALEKARALPENSDRSFSENPDRGYASGLEGIGLR